MGYSVKWVTDNLGITRDMLRYYEKENLLPREEARNPSNKYRDYDESDLERIWGIKLLIGIGFSAKEIYSMMNDEGFDFDMAMEIKVKDLQRKHDEDLKYLEFAKSIKLLGRVPTTSQTGSMRFDEFLSYVQKEWNFYEDPQSAPYAELSEKVLSNDISNLSDSDVDRILSIFEDTEGMLHAYALHGYYQVISDMQEHGYDSEVVQCVVASLHKYLVKHNTAPELEGKITAQFVAKYTAPFFISGDISKQHERNYGREGCIFIAHALAFYGGINFDEL